MAATMETIMEILKQFPHITIGEFLLVVIVLVVLYVWARKELYNPKMK